MTTTASARSFAIGPIAITDCPYVVDARTMTVRENPEYGVKPAWYGERETMKAQRREMARLYREGHCPRAISVSMKVSLRFVYRNLSAAMRGH